jgi:hypothetical protein
MAFGSPFAQKPRRAEPVRPLTGALVRIVIVALLAVGGAAWGIYVYYTHALRVKTRTNAAPSETWVEIDLNSLPSASASPSASAPVPR